MKKRVIQKFMPVPVTFRAVIVLFVILCIGTAIGYADTCQNNNPGKINNYRQDIAGERYSPASSGGKEVASVNDDASTGRGIKASGHETYPTVRGHSDAMIGKKGGERQRLSRASDTGIHTKTGYFAGSMGTRNENLLPDAFLGTLFRCEGIALKRMFPVPGIGFSMGFNPVFHAVLGMKHASHPYGIPGYNATAMQSAVLSSDDDDGFHAPFPNGKTGPHTDCDNHRWSRMGGNQILKDCNIDSGTSRDHGGFPATNQ